MPEENYTRQESLVPFEFEQILPFADEKDGIISLSLKSSALNLLANHILQDHHTEALDYAMKIYRGISTAYILLNKNMVVSGDALLALSKILEAESKIPQNQTDDNNSNIEPVSSRKPSEGYVFCYTVIDNSFQLIEIDELLANLAQCYVNGKIDEAKNSAKKIMTSFNYGNFIKNYQLMEVNTSISSFEMSNLLRDLPVPLFEEQKNASDEYETQLDYMSDAKENQKIGLFQRFKSFCFFLLGSNEDDDSGDNDDDDDVIIGN